MRQKQFLIIISLGLIVSLGLTACAPKEAESQPATSPSSPIVSPIDEGKSIYSANCAACHGTEAQGTTVAMGLPGHSATAIERQVRSPMGKMPAFSASQVSDEQLQKMIAYITSLPAPEGHIEPLDMEDAVIVHHWMAIFALKDGDAEEARHHMEHILGGLTDAEHKHVMEEAMEMAAAGNFHDAEHEVEELLAGQVQPELSMTQMHLQLASSAMSVRETADARHHMEHFLAEASGMEKVKGEEVINLIDMDDMHEAGHALEEMMGMTPHGG